MPIGFDEALDLLSIGPLNIMIPNVVSLTSRRAGRLKFNVSK
jgi:hypothetical protein